MSRGAHLLVLVLAIMLGLGPVVQAADVLPSLTPDTLRGVAPLLLRGDLLVLPHSDSPEGVAPVVLMARVAAPPALVRGVVAQPQRYPAFMPNLSVSDVTHGPAGEVHHRYRLSLGLLSFAGEATLVAAAPGADATPPVLITEESGSRYRWEFLPLSGGAATLVVFTGYTNLWPMSAIVSRLLWRMPQLFIGFAALRLLVELRPVRAYAESLAAAPLPSPAPEGGARYDDLLAQGTLVLLRHPSSLAPDAAADPELNLISRSSAAPEVMLAVLGDPARWAPCPPVLLHSFAVPGTAEDPVVDLDLDPPLARGQTQYRVRLLPRAVDMLGVEGDLRGGRLRWDVRARPGASGADPLSVLSLRARLPLARGSLILRQLIAGDPAFSSIFALTVDLMLLRCVRDLAERS